MAVIQAERVAADLAALGVDVEIVQVTTSGDTWTGALSDLGGKGAFTRELDAAQLAGEVSLTVHCLKDVPSDLPAGLTVAAYLPREDVHDAVVSRGGGDLDGLPDGAVLGTSSVRRSAQVARGWPRLRVMPIRGNADTRLRKLDSGEYDAVILAVAGLRRIGEAERISAFVPTDLMLPAVGAGTIVIVARADDPASLALAGRLDDPSTRRVSTAERVMLASLGGNCHSPIAGHATIEADGSARLRGAVYSLDGSTCLEAVDWDAGDGNTIGEAVAAALLAKGARQIIDSTAP